MTNKEMNKKINEMEQTINSLIEYLYLKGDSNASVIKYYFTQHNYEEIIKFLLGDK